MIVRVHPHPNLPPSRVKGHRRLGVAGGCWYNGVSPKGWAAHPNRRKGSFYDDGERLPAGDGGYGARGRRGVWLLRHCGEAVREGWEMTYVLCTDGSKGSSDREMTGEELSRIRRRNR